MFQLPILRVEGSCLWSVMLLPPLSRSRAFLGEVVFVSWTFWLGWVLERWRDISPQLTFCLLLHALDPPWECLESRWCSPGCRWSALARLSWLGASVPWVSFWLSFWLSLSLLLEIRFPAKKIYGLLKDAWWFTLNPPSLAQPNCRVRPIDSACLCVPVVYVLACLESMCMMSWGAVPGNSYEFIGRLSIWSLDAACLLYIFLYDCVYQFYEVAWGGCRRTAVRTTLKM